jgi:hypothetical protein
VEALLQSWKKKTKRFINIFAFITLSEERISKENFELVIPNLDKLNNWRRY